MPIPKPKEGESEPEFIRRCVSDDTMVSEFPKLQQRLAVCYGEWRKK